MPSDSQRDILAQVMADGRKILVPLLAELLKTNRVQDIDSSEERTRFWQRALTEEEEDALWQDAILANGITGPLTAEQVVKLGLPISQQVYPDRWDMAGSEGRTTDAQQAMWALKHASKGPPVPKPEQVAPAPVEPPEEEAY